MEQIKAILRPCGLDSCLGAAIDEVEHTVPVRPSKQEVMDKVQRHVPELGKNYVIYMNKYSHGMERVAPKSYVCEEVLQKGAHDGKLHWTLGVDDEKAVKQAALLAATNKDTRLHIQEEVWEDLEPTVAARADAIPHEKAREKARGKQTTWRWISRSMISMKLLPKRLRKEKSPFRRKLHTSSGTEFVG